MVVQRRPVHVERGRRLVLPGRKFPQARLDLAKGLVKHEIMVVVGVHEAKSTLSQLLRRVAAGDEVTITRGGEPLARLVPVAPRVKRRFGQDRGMFEVPDDFNAPLPEDLQQAFES